MLEDARGAVPLSLSALGKISFMLFLLIESPGSAAAGGDHPKIVEIFSFGHPSLTISGFPG
jgi:hypothetical protein